MEEQWFHYGGIEFTIIKLYYTVGYNCQNHTLALGGNSRIRGFQLVPTQNVIHTSSNNISLVQKLHVNTRGTQHIQTHVVLMPGCNSFGHIFEIQSHKSLDVMILGFKSHTPLMMKGSESNKNHWRWYVSLSAGPIYHIT